MAYYLNRNLRHGNAENRFVQYMVIKGRFYPKKMIKKNFEFIRSQGRLMVTERL